MHSTFCVKAVRTNFTFWKTPTCAISSRKGLLKLDILGAGEIAQRWRALVALPEVFDSIPSTHMKAHNSLELYFQGLQLLHICRWNMNAHKIIKKNLHTLKYLEVAFSLLQLSKMFKGKKVKEKEMALAPAIMEKQEPTRWWRGDRGVLCLRK